MIRVLDIPVVRRVVTLFVCMAVARSRLVLPVTMHLSLCSFCLSAGPRCWHHGFGGMHEVVALVVDNGSGMFYAGFTGNDTPRAVLLVCRQVRRKVLVACAWLVLLVLCAFMRCSFVCRQARDARHHGWYALARCWARCAQRQVPLVYVAVNMLRQVPAVLFDSGSCFIFCLIVQRGGFSSL